MRLPAVPAPGDPGADIRSALGAGSPRHRVRRPYRRRRAARRMASRRPCQRLRPRLAQDAARRGHGRIAARPGARHVGRLAGARHAGRGLRRSRRQRRRPGAVAPPLARFGRRRPARHPARAALRARARASHRPHPWDQFRRTFRRRLEARAQQQRLHGARATLPHRPAQLGAAARLPAPALPGERRRRRRLDPRGRIPGGGDAAPARACGLTGCSASSPSTSASRTGSRTSVSGRPLSPWTRPGRSWRCASTSP